MNLFIAQYIHVDQVRFIPRWQLRDNSRKIFNINSYVWDNKTLTWLYFVDAEKAFDSVELGYLKAVLAGMGFGIHALDWFSLFNTMHWDLFLEGFRSRTISLFNGMWQGFPLSPMLLYGGKSCEGESEYTRGLRPLTSCKLMLSSDDVVFMLQDPVNSWNALGFTVECFGAASGYKINQLKLAIMDINIPSEWRIQLEALTSAPWEESVTYLGIRFVGSLDTQVL